MRQTSGVLQLYASEVSPIHAYNTTNRGVYVLTIGVRRARAQWKTKPHERLRITSQKQLEMDNQTHKFKKIRHARRFTHHICTKLYRWLASSLFRRLGNC